MIKRDRKNQRGITLTTLVIAIIILLIITSTLLYNISTGSQLKALNDMYQDVKKLKDKVDLYYSSYHTIPIIEGKYDNISNIESINPNDSDTYYVIDLEDLDNINLHYGKDYKNYKNSPSMSLTDIYIVNDRSHNVYYIKGIQVDDVTYYTIPEENTKIDLNEILTISVIGKNNDFVNVKIDAVDKTNGIKNLTVMVDEKPYKTYNYTSNERELRTEILQIELTQKERDCYFKVEYEKGESKSSNHITLERKIIDVSVLKAGDYIKYDTGVSTVGENGVITCRVLYPLESEYGLQIISDKNVGIDITLGGNTWKEGKIAYNEAIKKLNDEAEKYVNIAYAYDGRCVGSIPTVQNGMFVEKDKGTETTVILQSGWTRPIEWTSDDTGCYDADANYTTDQIALEGANIWITGQYYWLASRVLESNSDSSAVYFSGRRVDANGDVRGTGICNVYSGGHTSGALSTVGFRPCISLKSDIIQIIDGDGETEKTAFEMGI